MMGRPGYFDVSVWSPLQSSLINEASGHAGVAAESGETSVHNCGGMFFLLVVECYGCWPSKSLEHLEDIHS